MSDCVSEPVMSANVCVVNCIFVEACVDVLVHSSRVCVCVCDCVLLKVALRALHGWALQWLPAGLLDNLVSIRFVL